MTIETRSPVSRATSPGRDPRLVGQSSKPVRPRKRRNRNGRAGNSTPASGGPQAGTNNNNETTTPAARKSARARRFDAGRPQPHQNRAAIMGSMFSAAGVLELHPDGYGFLRDAARDLRPTPADVYVPAPLIQALKLRVGDEIQGAARQSGKQGPRLETVSHVDGGAPEDGREARTFEELTPINPHRALRLETTADVLTTRVIDLLAPLGRGQRGLIVAPPRSGKTVLLHHIGQAIAANHPDVRLMVLLIDERPEEVTEMRRKIPGEVFASSLDHDVESHVRLSRLVVERCQRLAERGEHVMLMIDSLTRMARAFNKWVGNTGRTMSGGMDVKALDIPKKLFASARTFEEGGSLTILGTALVETGSRMDDVIFEEFKGTGNMELVLDRALADRRVWPALDISASGTRREEKLLPLETLETLASLRRGLNTMHPVEAMRQLTTQLAKYPNNAEFLSKIRQRISVGG